jgi:hypothetical protein
MSLLDSCWWIKINTVLYCYCYFYGGGIAQGVPYIAIIIDLLFPPQSSSHSWLIHQSSIGSNQQMHLVAKQEKLGEKWPWILLRSIFFHTCRDFLTCSKILRHGIDGFTSPSEEVGILIFIALKNPSSSAGHESSKLGSNRKHHNHYISEVDHYNIKADISNKPFVNIATYLLKRIMITIVSLNLCDRNWLIIVVLLEIDHCLRYVI